MGVGRIGETGPDTERLLARDGMRRHLPPVHPGQRLAVRTRKADRNRRERGGEVALHLAGRLGPWLRGDGHGHAGRGEDIAATVGAMGPAACIGGAGNAIAGLARRFGPVGGDGDANDAVAIRLDRDLRAVALDDRQRIGRQGQRRAPQQQCGDHRPTLCPLPMTIARRHGARILPYHVHPPRNLSLVTATLSPGAGRERGYRGGHVRR